MSIENRFHGQDSEMEGWLYKWTNYLKGYQKRWFVLSNGLLSYSRNPAEMSHTCRGTISLVSAVIHTEDSCNFVISNGGTQTFHLKASNEIERQKWVTALELAKARAIRILDSEDDDEYAANQLIDAEKQEIHSILKPLTMKLEDLRTCHDLIIKHGSALQRSLMELEQVENPMDAINRCKVVNEKATLFRITSNTMINASAEYLITAQTHGKKWSKVLQHEHDSRLRLEEMVEQLAKQHSHLELRAIQEVGQASSPIINSPTTINSDDDEFFDAEEAATDFYVPFPGIAHRVGGAKSVHPFGPALQRVPSKKEEKCDQWSVGDYCQENGQHKRESLVGEPPRTPGSSNSLIRDDEASSGSEDLGEALPLASSAAGVITRRVSKNTKNPSFSSSPMTILKKGESEEGSYDDGISRSWNSSTPSSLDRNMAGNAIMKQKIPRSRITERPNHSVNLWSIMKNCIGKELTKIPMPVNFNEPLSMLQRVTEDYEYAELLHKAAKMQDACDQLIYVAAFCVSNYSTTSNRTGKPFNPLLGETFEFDRSDDLGWKSIAEQVSHHPPMLAIHCEGKGWTISSEYAMSSKFRGKYLQINPIDITHLTFTNSGHHLTWKRVTTTVHNIIVGRLWVDNHGELVITNHTTGDECHLKFIPYSYFSRDVPRKVTGCVIDSEGVAKWALIGTWDNKLEASRVIGSGRLDSKGKPLLETSTPKVIWKRILPPEYSERMYNMSMLAIQLNEEEENVAPTDSRNRPDQRNMELGYWDEANRIKGLLEEKQRAVRRRREKEAEMAAREGRPYECYEPIWFEKRKDPITGNPMHVYLGQYWEAKKTGDWSQCPDIYLSPEELNPNSN